MYHIANLKTYRASSVDPDEVAHNEPPHLDLHSLQVLIKFVFGILKVKEEITVF